ncbi:LysR family transcriptional regulator [Sporomusa termitida]|uniref:HTH-type transcriptional regulator CynR n=1 Tax=Sporomusa termitida TaxID=2377 RepID=A0A517DQ23_9FIRM|nr:LysR family transcriptional regulator [Sporomusa termitida]QDR79408.1 HTH-type transcriptional regulator CynR [Sporomusa termitida]
MDILHLTYFIEVAKQGSFTRAAQALHVSQPSISKMVRNLENELGVILIDRSGRKTKLTDAGQALYEHGINIIASLNNAAADLDALIGCRKGQIRIGIPPMVETSFFAIAIGEFKKKYPDILIDLIEVGSKAIEKMVEEGQLEIGVVVLPVKNKANFSLFAFVKDPIQLIVHPEHRLAARDIAHITDLADESVVMYRKDFALHDHIIEKCREYGFMPRVLCESSQWDFMVEIVAAKLGVALLPKMVCAKLAGGVVKALPLAEEIRPWHLAVIWKKDTYLSYAAREWLNYTACLFGVDVRLK